MIKKINYTKNKNDRIRDDRSSVTSNTDSLCHKDNVFDIESYKNSYYLNYRFYTYIFNRFIFSKLNVQLKERFYKL